MRVGEKLEDESPEALANWMAVDDALGEHAPQCDHVRTAGRGRWQEAHTRFGLEQACFLAQHLRTMGGHN